MARAASLKFTSAAKHDARPKQHAMPLIHTLLLATLAPHPQFLFGTFHGEQALQLAARWGSRTELSPAHLQRLVRAKTTLANSGNFVILAAQAEHNSKAIPSLLVFQPASEEEHVLKVCLWDQRLSVSQRGGCIAQAQLWYARVFNSTFVLPTEV